jgi:CHAT domain-containing protein/tetratricopeptide (TPR) repeat protein
VLVRFQEYVLRKVRRALAVAGEPKAPSCHSFVMPREQLVDEHFPVGACSASGLGQQVRVGEFGVRHPLDYIGRRVPTWFASDELDRRPPSSGNKNWHLSTVWYVRFPVRSVLVWLASAWLAPAVAGQTRDIQAALNEASHFAAAGNSAAALEAYRWALEASDPDSSERARALLGVAAVEIGEGKYADARQHAADAARLFEQIGDVEQASLSLNRQGTAAVNAGDYDDAERQFTAALQRSTKANFLEGRTEQLGNLASVKFYLGRYADAQRLYQEAIALTTASPPAPWVARRHRILLANEASLFQRLGRDQEALAIYRDLGMATELRPHERAEMLVNLGVLYRRLGDPIKALATYVEARALFARDHDVDGELNADKNRGIVLALDLARLGEAERSFSSALEAATKVGNRREMLHARLYRGETRRRAGRDDPARDDFAAALTLARELKTPEEEWKALFGLGRLARERTEAIAYLDDAVKTIEHVREGIRVPSLSNEFLNDKREVYDALIAASLSSATPAALFQLVERSHSRVWRERLHLGNSNDLARVQERLPDRTLLLDYWNGDQGSAVVVVSRERAAVVPIRADEKAVKTLVDTLAAGRSSTWREQGAALGSRLLPPPEWFDGVDRIFIVPDGALALVPFDVLSVDSRLIVERAAVTYMPTAALLLRDGAGSAWLPPWKLQLRVFADPLINSGDRDAESHARRLTASAEEAREVAGEIGGRALLHVGAENRKAYLLGAERAPLLHLATHAMADSSAMERSHIVFSPSDGSTNADYLFLKEAYALRLDDVDLVVLSACDTERGRLIRGEGVQSFSRAFLAAGARSTVTTIWRVADEPTADFMQLFYHHLGRGEPRAEALRQAKLRFLRERSAVADPHYWAAFVLTGDGAHPVPRAITWTAVAGAAMTLVFVGSLTVRWYRHKKSVPR